jgi:acyl-CoA hydrolase
LTFVAIDQYGKPLPVPPIEPHTPEEQRRYEAAEIRRQQRLEQRELLRKRHEELQRQQHTGAC